MPTAESAKKLEFSSQVAGEIRAFSRSLGLDDWDIRVGDPDRFDYDLCEEGYIIRQDDERVATLYVHPEADAWQIERIVVHELLHVVLADLEFIASNGATVETMELYARFQERAISVLVGAITGNTIWQPVEACQKLNHAPGHNLDS